MCKKHKNNTASFWNEKNQPHTRQQNEFIFLLKNVMFHTFWYFLIIIKTSETALGTLKYESVHFFNKCFIEIPIPTQQKIYHILFIYLFTWRTVAQINTNPIKGQQKGETTKITWTSLIYMKNRHKNTSFIS